MKIKNRKICSTLTKPATLRVERKAKPVVVHISPKKIEKKYMKFVKMLNAIKL